MLTTTRSKRVLQTFVLALLLTLGAISAHAEIHVVELAGLDYTPPDITIQVGDTVRWEWVSGFHNVESGVSGVHDGNFLSGNPTGTPGTVFEVVFDEGFLAANPMPNDEYPYYCIVHWALGMTGIVRVQAGGPTVVDFDGTSPLGPLTGIFDGIDWGAAGWYTYAGDFGACGGPLAIPLLFISRFDFVDASVLLSLDVSLRSPAVPQTFLVVSRDAGGQALEFMVAQVSPDSCQTIETGFTQAAHDIVLLDFSQQVLNVAIDNVTYLTP